jgi:hypothetical protein
MTPLPGWTNRDVLIALGNAGDRRIRTPVCGWRHPLSSRRHRPALSKAAHLRASRQGHQVAAQVSLPTTWTPSARHGLQPPFGASKMPLCPPHGVVFAFRAWSYKEVRTIVRIPTFDAAPGSDQPHLVMVSWIRQNARSAELAHALGAAAVYMPWAWPGQPLRRTILGWLRSGVRTWQLVRSLPRGSAVVVMAPPVFCPLVALWAAQGHNVRVAIDLHSGGLNDPSWRWSFGLMRWAIRQAATVIITNPDLLEEQDIGLTPVQIIQDPFWIEDETEAGSVLPPRPPYAVFPASGAPDEPIDAVVEAAALLSGQMDLVVTGEQSVRPDTPGLRLTGFIPATEFRELMAHAAVVLALTTREATMQRAAYEGLQLCRPLVCSGTRVLRRVLMDAAVFVENNGPSIAAGVLEAVARADELRAAGEARQVVIKAEAQQGLAVVRALVTGQTALATDQ